MITLMSPHNQRESRFIKNGMLIGGISGAALSLIPGIIWAATNLEKEFKNPDATAVRTTLSVALPIIISGCLGAISGMLTGAGVGLATARCQNHYNPLPNGDQPPAQLHLLQPLLFQELQALPVAAIAIQHPETADAAVQADGTLASPRNTSKDDIETGDTSPPTTPQPHI
ncbi:MAG: hypothetical protein P1U34_01355 [Coxiellaceae bacterium]|nr:hypothetical protein [Coxiellaceae bacterium]